MPSVVTLDVGNCGCTLGYAFWKNIAEEHGLDCMGHFIGSKDEQVRRIDVYFSESRVGRFIPRNVMVDLDPKCINQIRQYERGQMFEPNSLIHGEETSDNNFARGYCQAGETVLNSTNESLRRQIEGCNSYQGLQMCHAIGGGCGSGFASLLLEHARGDYEKELILSFTVFPAPNVSDVVVEPYNAILTTKRLIEDVNAVVCIDNEALQHICVETMHQTLPQYSDMNYLISLVMNGMTSSVRYNGQLNSNFRKIALNMIPYGRLHFFCCGFAPLCSKNDLDYQISTVNDLVLQIFHTETMMCAIDPTVGKYFTASCIFRGDMSMKSIEMETSKVQQANSTNFFTWMPQHIFNSCVDVSHLGFPRSCTFLGNTTSITTMFKRIDEAFTTMFAKDAYIHWYAKAGLDAQNMYEAQQNMVDMVQSYDQYFDQDHPEGDKPDDDKTDDA